MALKNFKRDNSQATDHSVISVKERMIERGGGRGEILIFPLPPF